MYCDGVGVPAPSFQWYKNNAPIEGATFRELTKLSVTSEDQGNYFCKVYNSAGEVSSDLIQVIVAPAGTVKLLFIVIHVFMSCLLKKFLFYNCKNPNFSSVQRRKFPIALALTGLVKILCLSFFGGLVKTKFGLGHASFSLLK